MEDEKEILRRLAIAVETLATMTLEALARIESRQVQAPAPVKAESNTKYWIQYVIPVALGIVSHLVMRFLTTK